MEDKQAEVGGSLAETPSWAFATVITVLVTLGFLCSGSLQRFGKWSKSTKRKSLVAALEKIKEELMMLGLLSLLMGHWIVFVAKICVKSSAMTSRFYPCSSRSVSSTEHIFASSSGLNKSLIPLNVNRVQRHYCPEGKESFASYESLEQLHRFLFVLSVTHVAYSFIAIALSMIKIYSWRSWETQAKMMAIIGLEDSPRAAPMSARMTQLSTFISRRTSHPWSQHRALVWLLCFTRQFWTSINRADYLALRMGFISNHELPLSYDFHKYMVRSMEDEFRDIVGISVPLWIYAILCIFMNFHGTNAYFWLSFLPAILLLLIGTKLHRIVVKLAVEIMDKSPWMENHQFHLRDELFWFGKPKLLLKLVQLISFQNAFEMASFLWALWEFRDSSCFMDNHKFLLIRLTFGVVSQCWCSFITFPLYVIITQMGTRLKKSVVSEDVRVSLHGWQKRVKAKHTASLLSVTSVNSLDSMVEEIDEIHEALAQPIEEGSLSLEDPSLTHQHFSYDQTANELPECDENAKPLSVLFLIDDSMVEEIDEIHEALAQPIEEGSLSLEDPSLTHQHFSFDQTANELPECDENAKPLSVLFLIDDEEIQDHGNNDVNDDTSFLVPQPSDALCQPIEDTETKNIV